MTIDATVTFGNLLTILALVASVVAAFVAMRSQLQSVAARLASLEVISSKMTDAFVRLAQQEERLNAHSQRISRLERDGNT